MPEACLHAVEVLTEHVCPTEVQDVFTGGYWLYAGRKPSARHV